MANRFWIAGATQNYNATAYWSTSSGGGGGASVPGASDNAIFDGNGLGNCTLDISPTVINFDVQSGYTGTIDNSGNPNYSVSGSLSIDSGATWTKGTGTITLIGAGAGTQTIDTNNKLIEDIIINDAGATKQLSSALNTDILIHNAGILDPNGKNIATGSHFTINDPGDVMAGGLAGITIAVGGNFSVDGASGDRLDLNVGATWYLIVSGTATASFANVAYSDASGGSQIVATSSTDEGNTSNWNFINLIEDTQVYVTGVLYQTDAFPDDPHTVFDYVDENFREISGLEFEYLSINRTEARFSGGTTREQLLVFMKDVQYNDESYLTDTNSGNLRTTIISKLSTMSDISYTDVEVRSTRETI